MSLLNWYKNTSFHKWWMDNVWEPSWTKLVAFSYGIPASAVVVAEQISKFANDTTISGYLSQLNVPNWVPMALAGVALVHYVAHGRD